MRPMEALLERTFEAEQRHFWFRGFKRFVAPSHEGATAGRSHVHDCSTPGAAPAPTFAFLQQYGVPFGVELLLAWAAVRPCARLPSPAQGSVTQLPFADASIDVGAVVRRALLPPGRRRAAPRSHEMFRVLQARRCDRGQCGGAGHAEGRSLDAWRRSPPLHQARAEREAERAGFQVRRLTYTNASLFPITAAMRALQRLRGVKAGAGKHGRFLRSARARQRAVVRRARAGIEARRGRHQHAASAARCCAWRESLEEHEILKDP